MKKKKSHIGLFQTKTKRGLRIYFSEPPPPPHTHTHTHFGDPKVKNQDPWKLHMIFSWIPLEVPLFLFTPGFSTHFFFNILGNSMKFHLDFSEIAHYCSCMPTFLKLWFGVYTMCTRFVKTWWYLSQCKCNIARVII